VATKLDVDDAPSALSERPAGPPVDRTSTAALIVMALAATVAGFGLVSPLAHWAINPVDLPAPLPDQNQDAESLTSVLSFAVLLPLMAFLLPARLDRISGRHGGTTSTALVLLLGIALCALICAVKLAGHLISDSRLAMLFAASAVWWVLAAAVLAVSLRRETTPRLIARIAPGLWPALAASVVVVILCFVDLGSIAVAPLAVGVVIAAAVGYGVASRPFSFRPPPRRWRWAVDVAAVALIALAVPNLVVFRPEDPSAVLETQIIQFHQNLWLGPANALVHGGTMLVNVLSQYGVGSIVFLGAVFEVIPIGNGTLALVEAAFSVGAFALAYLTLRLSGVGLGLTWATLTVAVVILVFNLVYPLGALLQHGALRFGLPMVILAAAAGEGRTARRDSILRGVEAAAFGVASLWSFEALVYSVGALGGIILFRAATAPSRRRWVAASGVLDAIAACVVVQVVFALATLAAAGQLPDWGGYITTVREFLTGPVGDLTYDFSPWSAGLPLGALYAASALALILVVRREPGFVAKERPTLLVLSAATGYGLALFTYFINRSANHILPYISLPAVMIVALWLAIMLRDERFSPRARGVAVASTVGVAALLVAVAWSNVGLRFSQSALAYVPPGGKSLRGALHRLWHPPPLAYGAADATHLLETYLPDEHESVVLTAPDLGVEALVRTDRVNAIPLSDPWEDSLVADLHESEVNDAIADLKPGRRMLIDRSSRAVLRGLGEGSSSIVPNGIAPLEVTALREISERFRLQPIARSPSGVEVVELRAR
jgi:hypothetical protein